MSNDFVDLLQKCWFILKFKRRSNLFTSPFALCRFACDHRLLLNYSSLPRYIYLSFLHSLHPSSKHPTFLLHRREIFQRKFSSTDGGSRIENRQDKEVHMWYLPAVEAYGTVTKREERRRGRDRCSKNIKAPVKFSIPLTVRSLACRARTPPK